MDNSRWGIDLGGTKIEGVVLSGGPSPQVLCRRRIATEADQGYEHILERIRILVGQMSAETGLHPGRIGVGHPGTLDPCTGLIKNANTTALIGRPFDRDLSALLGGIPVATANDANCFAVAEALMGAAPEIAPKAEVVFGVIMGTGVGGGWVLRGRVWNGRQGIGGEWGHNFLDESGGPCYCGKTGCVETLISGPATERYYARTAGIAKSLPQIVADAQRGSDPHAVNAIDRLCRLFGRAIAVVINLMDPDVIVLGGGLSAIDALYTHGVSEALPHLFNDRMDTLFARPRLGDSAGVFGAALL